MTSSYTFLVPYGNLDICNLTLPIDSGEILDYLSASEDNFETHIVSGLAFGPHTLIKIFLKIDIDIEHFLEAVLHSSDNDSDCVLIESED